MQCALWHGDMDSRLRGNDSVGVDMIASKVSKRKIPLNHIVINIVLSATERAGFA